MKAFHGDEAVKAKYVARLQAHRAADEIIQGTGWENGHGCAVGCTLNKYDHLAYEHELGLPQWLARLEDRIFEGLPAVQAQQFAVDFLNAIPVGADVSEVRFKLAALRGRKTRALQEKNTATYAKQCVAAIDLAIAYCEAETRTDEQRSAAAWSAWSAWSAADSAWSAAEAAAAWSAADSARSAADSARSAADSARSAQSAAESAAWSAAESAAESAESAESAAESAAQSAAWSAAAESAAAQSAESAAWSAAARAAWSAWSAAAEAAAESDHFVWEAATLLELLRSAPQAE